MTVPMTMQKPYIKPAIVHELRLETHAQTTLSSPDLNDPMSVDPVLPPKPDARDQSGAGGRIDPSLPPKPPVSRPSGGGGGGGGGGARVDPPLPPKPPKP
jgi:hypothetical protein